MKKSLMAVALVGAFAGVAHAQTSVQIYGTLDAGVQKRSGETLSIGKRAANTLGFKGTETKRNSATLQCGKHPGGAKRRAQRFENTTARLVKLAFHQLQPA